MEDLKGRFGVLLRPICCVSGWIMAEDYFLPCQPETTFEEIVQMIHAVRPHISPSRVLLVVSDKQIPENKMNWTLRRNTIADRSVIVVTPTMYDGWFWETKEHYRETFLTKIAMEIIAEPAAVLSLEDIEERCGEMPRPIRGTSVRALLRRYPEKFFIRHDTTLDKTWVMISDGMQVPLWQPSPVNMGTIVQYAPRKFDWDEYKSVDSMAKAVLNIDRPGAKLRFHIQKMTNVRLESDPFKKPNIYCTFWWNNDAEEEEFHENFNFDDVKTRVGETEICDDSFNPEWDYEAWTVETGQLGDIDACALKIEVYHAALDIEDDDDAGAILDEHGRNREYDELLGIVKIDGRDLLKISRKGALEGNVYPVMPLPKKRGAPAVDPVGLLTLGGGEGSGLHVSVNCILNHKEFREKPYQRALVVVVFNGVEIGQTPIARDAVDPGWVIDGRMGEVFSFEVPKNMRLRQCELEFLLWITDQNDGKGKYFGSAIFAGRKLESLVGLQDEKKTEDGFDQSVYRKYAIAHKQPLEITTSPLIPRNLRNPMGISGSMTLIVGPPGLRQNTGREIELSVVKMNDCHKINFAVARVTWNGVRIGISAPARLRDQDWKNSSAFTELEWSRNGDKPNASFCVPLAEGKRTVDGCELRLEFFEMVNGENFVDMKARRAKLGSDPKGKAYIPAETADGAHEAAKHDREVKGEGGGGDGETTALGVSESVSLVSARYKAPVVKPAAPGQYLGLLMLSGTELSEVFDNKFAVTKEFTITSDYDRDGVQQKWVKRDTKVTITCGMKGARTPEERILTIDALDMLNLYGLFEDPAKKKREAAAKKAKEADEANAAAKPSFSLGFLGGGGGKADGADAGKGGDDAAKEGEDGDAKIAEGDLLPEGEPVDLFCVLFWNGVEKGRTQIVSSSNGSVVFANENFYLPLTAPARTGSDDVPISQNAIHQPVQNTFTCRLEIEVVDSREASLGYIKLDGRKVGALLEAKVPQSQIHDLTPSQRFSARGRAVCKGKIKLSTCGLEIPSPFMVDDAKAAQKARAEAAAKKKAEKEAKAAKKAADKQAKKEAKKKAKAEAKAKALAKEAALAAAL